MDARLLEAVMRPVWAALETRRQKVLDGAAVRVSVEGVGLVAVWHNEGNLSIGANATNKICRGEP